MNEMNDLSSFLDGKGLGYFWKKIVAHVAERTGSVAWEDVTGKPELALKSDLSSVYRFKGSVANYASLPAEGNVAGDVWNVEATGMNYAWTGKAWDALGESFQVESISNAEIDAIVAEA